LFFKGIKQHLRIKAFFDMTPNAVKAQLWTAVIAYMLVVKLKRHCGLSREIYEIPQIPRAAIFEKNARF
jgi:IS4 transposase